MKDLKVITTLIAFKNDSDPLSNDLDPEVAQAINEVLATLTKEIDLESSESEITGKKLANWISPFHLEANLNSALNALDDVELLLKELREIDLAKIQLISTRRLIAKSGSGHEAILTIHDELVKEVGWDEIERNQALRFWLRMIDLIEFTKAVKLAGEQLYHFSATQMDYNYGAKGIRQIRESLRKFLLNYRKELIKEREVTIPISLKYARKSDGRDGDYLVAKWDNEGVERFDRLPIDNENLEFDLREYVKVALLRSQRIVRVGFQVIDHLIEQPIDKIGDRGDHQSFFTNFWNLTLSDQSDGKTLGDSSTAAIHKIQPLQMTNVIGSRNPSEITWGINNSLINMNADRKWKLEIKNSHLGRNESIIYDVVIHFHLRVID